MYILYFSGLLYAKTIQDRDYFVKRFVNVNVNGYGPKNFRRIENLIFCIISDFDSELELKIKDSAMLGQNRAGLFDRSTFGPSETFDQTRADKKIEKSA